VGDHQFRAKCTDRFRELKEEGVTTVVVSHNRHMIEHMCTRTIYLRDGRIVHDGDPSVAWDRYLADAARNGYALNDNLKKQPADSEKQMVITGAEVLDQDGNPKAVFDPGEPAQARIAFQVQGHVDNPVFYARLYRDGDLVHGTNSARHGIEGTYRPGDRGVATIHYHALPFLEGRYQLDLGIEKSFSSRASYDRAPPLYVTVGGGLSYGAGKVYVDHEWHVGSTEGDMGRSTLWKVTNE
jgi:ABC-2 type transport system ATP-binding protein